MEVIDLKICEKCKGLLWVCENHRSNPWNGDCCGGAGAPCECNTEIENPRGFVEGAEVSIEELKSCYKKIDELNELVDEKDTLLKECEVIFEKIVQEFNQPTEGALVGSLIARLDNANHFIREIHKKVKNANP